MAQGAYFFDAVYHGGVYDRAYNADDFAKYLSDLIGNGVIYNISTALQVTVKTNMKVNVLAGMAFLQGRKYENTTPLELTIPTANGSLPRIDRVVVKLDKTNRTIAAVIKAGTASSVPSAPVLAQTADVYEISLARIHVKANTTAILASDITDERLDEAVCGIVTGLIQQIDASTLFAQLEAQFNVWFSAMQDQLSTEAAGNLQTQINTLGGQIGYSGTSGGMAPAYTITLNDFTLVSGAKVEVKIHAGTTSAATLNITAHNTTTQANTVLGAKPIVDSYGSPIDYLTTGAFLTLVYNGTAFQVMGLSTQYARYA